ncbi:hypothetical protein ERO13_A01G098200v2 [Gossypium hirsutum]|nr:hypothetical protein ERO13_A01G098200v2 [Gossypium hirsutum]
MDLTCFKTLFSQNFSSSFPFQSTEPKGYSLFASTLSNRTLLNPHQSFDFNEFNKDSKAPQEDKYFCFCLFYFLHTQITKSKELKAKSTEK